MGFFDLHWWMDARKRKQHSQTKVERAQEQALMPGTSHFLTALKIPQQIFGYLQGSGSSGSCCFVLRVDDFVSTSNQGRRGTRFFWRAMASAGGGLVAKRVDSEINPKFLCARATQVASSEFMSSVCMFMDSLSTSIPDQNKPLERAVLRIIPVGRRPCLWEITVEKTQSDASFWWAFQVREEQPPGRVENYEAIGKKINPRQTAERPTDKTDAAWSRAQSSGPLLDSVILPTVLKLLTEDANPKPPTLRMWVSVNEGEEMFAEMYMRACGSSALHLQGVSRGASQLLKSELARK